MLPAAEGPVRVVVHVDDASADRQRLALGNVANLLADVGPGDAAVEIVFNGPAISAVTASSALSGELSSLRARGVEILACHNSMVAVGIKSNDLFSGATVVPSGISHLVRRQRDGWAYIRP
ncbi:MAG: DsrE family protein [Solirubrobacteraceae bacterium]